MLKKIASGIVALTLSGATTLADVNIPSTGVWSGGPRAYIGSTLANLPLELNKPYAFKIRLENTGTSSEPINLTGRVIGQGIDNLFYDRGFSLSPGLSTPRGGLFGEFPSQGDYETIFNWDYSGNQLSSSKTFNVIPEPTSLLLWVLPAYQLFKKRRR